MAAQPSQTPSVSQTILQQLGGNRFVAMTGASSFAGGDDVLTFRLPARTVKNGGAAMRITLMPSDTYKLELMKMVDFECVTLDTREDVYVDQLRSIFTDMTGLHASL